MEGLRRRSGQPVVYLNMFSFFKKKSTGITVTDRVWISEAAKWKALEALFGTDPSLLLICWFDETYRKAESIFAVPSGSPVSLLTARDAGHAGLSGKTPVFAEHYPLPEKENHLYTKLGLSNVLVYSSLDEPLFTHFGSDKIIAVMRQMGMEEDQPVEHSLVTQSIIRAQEKIAKKCVVEQSAASPADWFRKNFTP